MPAQVASATQVGASAQSNLPPFRAAAARHRNLAYTRPWATGQPIYIPLNRQGYLQSIRLNLALAVTPAVVAAGGDVPDADTLSNFFPTIALKSPQGDYIWSTSMRAMLDFNHRLRYGLKPVSDAASTTGFVDPTFVGINSASAALQNINVNFEIPLSLNWGLNFDTGLLMRQLANNDFTLQLNCANFTDLATGPAVNTAGHLFFGGSITGNIFIEEEWYEAVNPNVVTPPDFHAIIKLRDQQFGPLVVGDNFVGYSTGPTVLDMIHRVQANNAADNVDVNIIKVLVNKQTEIENRRQADIRRDNFLNFGKAMRTGVFCLDFFDDSDIANQTRARDFINSNMASQLDTVINTLNTFNTAISLVLSTYREMVTLGV